MGYEWLLATAIPHVGGVAGGIITSKAIPNWYNKLKKPWFNPPNWVFGPAWTSLYTGMGYASYMVWRDGGGLDGPARLPLTLYAIQLALNWAWTPIFFGMKRPGLAFLEIMALLPAIGACTVEFKSVNETAAWLMVPYLLWVGFASLLNYNIWKLNQDQKIE